MRIHGKNLLVTTMVMLCLCFYLTACDIDLGDEPRPSTTEAMTWMKKYDNGLALLRQEKYEEAVKTFLEVLEIDPTNVDAYSQLATIYAGEYYDDLKKAAEMLKKVLQPVRDIRRVWIV